MNCSGFSSEKNNTNYWPDLEAFLLAVGILDGALGDWGIRLRMKLQRLLADV